MENLIGVFRALLPRCCRRIALPFELSVVLSRGATWTPLKERLGHLARAGMGRAIAKLLRAAVPAEGEPVGSGLLAGRKRGNYAMSGATATVASNVR